MSVGLLDAMPGCDNPRVLCSTMDFSSGRSWGFHGGTTFVQRFRALTDGAPHQLGVRMGANQNPYSVALRLFVNDALVLERQYDNCRQRPEDWATVFDLMGSGATIAAGDWVRIELTPSMEIGIEPLFLENPDVPPGNLDGYGAMSARFYFCATLGGEPGTKVMTSTTSAHLRAPDAPRLLGDGPAYVIDGPDTDTAFAGERESWRLVASTPGLVFTKAVWILPAEAIAGYNADTGTITPFASTQLQMSAAFYFTRPGSYNVVLDTEADVTQPNGTVVHGAVRKTVRVTVTAPVISTSCSVASDVFVAPDPDEGNIDSIGFGNDLDAGFTMAVTVARGGAPTGNLRWVQLTQSMRQFVRKASAGGRTYTWSTPGWCLDNVVPYDQDVPFADPMLAARQEDSPKQGFRTNVQDCRVADQFRMYVMWKSSKESSIWITLGRFDWAWASRAMWSDVVGRYIRVDPETTYTNQASPDKANPALVTAYDLPTWGGVCPRDMAVVVTSAAPPVPSGLGDPTDEVPALCRRGPRPNAPRFQNGDTAWLSALFAPRIHNIPTYTLDDAERWLARRAGPLVTDGQSYYAMWATRENLSSAGFGLTHVMPTSVKLANLDMAPRQHSVDPKWYFRVEVAPFCYGDADYWKRFAHGPLRVGTVTDGIDTSLTAYVTALRAIVGSAPTMTLHSGWWVNIGFPSAPSMDTMTRIANLAQTHFVQRWMPDPVIPPDPDHHDTQ